MPTPRGRDVILYANLGLKSVVSTGERNSVPDERVAMGTGQSPLPRNSRLAT